jgi:hypothetical protein
MYIIIIGSIAITISCDYLSDLDLAFVIDISSFSVNIQPHSNTPRDYIQSDYIQSVISKSPE